MDESVVANSTSDFSWMLSFLVLRDVSVVRGDGFMKLLTSWPLSHEVRHCWSRQGRPKFHYDKRQCWRHVLLETCREHDNPTKLLTAMLDLICISSWNGYVSSQPYPNTVDEVLKNCFWSRGPPSSGNWKIVIMFTEWSKLLQHCTETLMFSAVTHLPRRRLKWEYITLWQNQPPQKSNRHPKATGGITTEHPSQVTR